MEVIVGLQTDIGLAVYVGCLLPRFYSPFAVQSCGYFSHREQQEGKTDENHVPDGKGYYQLLVDNFQL